MENILHFQTADATVHHQCSGEYEYYLRQYIHKAGGGSCVEHYEIPPGKSAYPYHYHMKSEESYYILSGTGLLRTPEGERIVNAGDFLHFPAKESGAHKLTNTSESENLVYLDFDIKHDLDVCIYPDSGKIGIWGMDINKLYRADTHVGYYDGE